MNRNDEDLIEIPLGENNFIEPAEYDGVQPTTLPGGELPAASVARASAARSASWFRLTSTATYGGR